MLSKLILILLLILTVGLIGYYLYNNQGKVKSVPIYSQPPVNQKTVTLPISPNDPGVETARIVYAFMGKITEIKNSDKNLIIKLDSKTSGLPTLTTNPQTLVLNQSKDQKVVQGTIDDVKVGLNVLVSTSYLLRDKSWTVEAIVIRQ